MLGGFSLISIQTLLHDSSRKEERIEKQRPGIKYRPLILKPSTTEAQDKSIQVATGPLVQKAPTVEALYFSASHISGEKIQFHNGQTLHCPHSVVQTMGLRRSNAEITGIENNNALPLERPKDFAQALGFPETDMHDLMRKAKRRMQKVVLEFGIPATTEGVELTEAQQKSITDQKLKDLKVKNCLFQAIDQTIMETILNRDTAKHIWDSMKQKY
ncbi:hypothetical protein CK203_023293 [Vitis vinifera]|uniref:Retrovirus-related Pol polyprotein from transposon TNT 1-94 n=1 Tax=Vitis vinifera TaxID=29760 RepID=A0A438J1U7_VITVI|nr:hypothetical protein CK203_023293 [Vitis vinifera]